MLPGDWKVTQPSGQVGGGWKENGGGEAAEVAESAQVRLELGKLTLAAGRGLAGRTEAHELGFLTVTDRGSCLCVFALGVVGNTGARAPHFAQSARPGSWSHPLSPLRVCSCHRDVPPCPQLHPEPRGRLLLSICGGP